MSPQVKARVSGDSYCIAGMTVSYSFGEKFVARVNQKFFVAKTDEERKKSALENFHHEQD